MNMLFRVIVAAVIVVLVPQVSQRLPRLGALLLTLPIVSIIAFVMSWSEHRDVSSIARLARETLILVPLGLPCFIPLAFSEKLGIGFWPALGAGIGAAALTIGLWFRFGPAHL